MHTRAHTDMTHRNASCELGALDPTGLSPSGVCQQTLAQGRLRAAVTGRPQLLSSSRQCMRLLTAVCARTAQAADAPSSPSNSCRCSSEPRVAAYISGLQMGLALRKRLTSAPAASSRRMTSVLLASEDTAACSGAKPSVGCNSSGSLPACTGTQRQTRKARQAAAAAGRSSSGRRQPPADDPLPRSARPRQQLPALLAGAGVSLQLPASQGHSHARACDAAATAGGL